MARRCHGDIDGGARRYAVLLPSTFFRHEPSIHQPNADHFGCRRCELPDVVTRRQLGVAVFARDERPGPTEIVTPSYATVDLGAGWRLSESVELRATVRNLFDSAYPASPDRRAVLAPGINAVITVVGEF